MIACIPMLFISMCPEHKAPTDVHEHARKGKCKEWKTQGMEKSTMEKARNGKRKEWNKGDLETTGKDTPDNGHPR